MKRVLMFFLLLLALSPLFAFSFFYGAGGEGERLDDENHYAGLSIDMGFSFFSEPYLMLDAEVVLSPLFESVSLNLSTSPFSTPVRLAFLFPNPVLYSPKLRIGAQYVYRDGWYYKAELALLNFRDTSFEYEFLTPILLIDALDYSLGYGVRLVKFTYFI